MVFVDADRDRCDFLTVDYDRQQGSYSDESYMAQNYDNGRVEDVHLSQSAGSRRNIKLETWVEEMQGELLGTIALSRVEWLLDWAQEKWPRPISKNKHVEDFQACLESYRWALQAGNETLDKALPMIRLGWGLCAVAIDGTSADARHFIESYPGFRARLQEYEPLIREIVGDVFDSAFR